MIAKIIISGAVIGLMAFHIIPNVTWPVMRPAMSETALAGELAIIGIASLGAAIMLAGIVGIFAKRM